MRSVTLRALYHLAAEEWPSEQVMVKTMYLVGMALRCVCVELTSTPVTTLAKITYGLNTSKALPPSSSVIATFSVDVHFQ